jgi:NADH-quinone oxidoreductase subunit N
VLNFLAEVGANKIIWDFPVPGANDIDWISVLPFIAIVGTGILALIIEMLKIKGGKRLVVATALLGLVVTGITIFMQIGGVYQESFGGMLTNDRLGLVLQLLLVVSCFLCVLFSEEYLREKKIAYGEFYPLVLWSTCGAMLMVSTRSLLVIFLGLEILSISLYVLAGMSRREHKSEESALKYFLLGAFASAFLLFGIAFIYGATGSLSIDSLFLTRQLHQPAQLALSLIGLGFMLIGLGFKSAFVPFHQWTPDVYQGAPTNVTAFMAAGSKIAALGVLCRILGCAPSFSQYLLPILFWIAILTMIIGNLAAVVQKDVKRILGFSSIAQAGYILVAVIAQVKNGNNGSYGTMVFYLLAYSLMTIGAFAVISLVAKDGKEDTRLADLNGLWKRSPFAAGSLIVFMASLIGIPFTAGFAGKLMIFRDALATGLTPLAIVLAVCSIISVAYYLQIGIAVFVADEDAEREQAKSTAGVLSVCALSALGVLGLFVFAGPFVAWINGH